MDTKDKYGTSSAGEHDTVAVTPKDDSGSALACSTDKGDGTLVDSTVMRVGMKKDAMQDSGGTENYTTDGSIGISHCDISISVEGPSVSKEQELSSYAEMDDGNVNKLSDSNEKEGVTLKKRAPIYICDVSSVPTEDSNISCVADHKEEAKDDDTCLGESSPPKTIIISRSPLHEVEESGQSHFESNPRSFSDADHHVSSQPTKSKINLSSKSPTELSKSNAKPCTSPSQASPYNTRFAHMKIGTIFSVSGRSRGISKRKIDTSPTVIAEDNSRRAAAPLVICEKPVDEGDVPDTGVCVLCGMPFADDMGIMMNVKKPLPLSRVDLVTLMESFSISVSSIKSQNVNVVSICNVCHTLVIEGDSAYKHLLSVASEMKEQWPFRAQKKNATFSLDIPESSADQASDYRSASDKVALPRKEESVHSEVRRVRGRVGRPPKIRIKQEDDADVNWKPSQVKLERTTHTGRRGRPPKRKMKRERRGRPRKIVIKGEPSEDEVYSCALCSESFQDEEEWGIHYESEHKPQLRWVNYRSQKKLKKLILLNLQESFLNKEFNNITCHACDKEYFDKTIFVDHLRNYHSMKVDDDFINALHNFIEVHDANLDPSESEAEKGTSSNGTMIKIEKEATVSEGLKCKICNLIMNNEKELRDHTSNNHFSLVVIANDDTKEIVLPEMRSTSEKISDETFNASELTDKENVEEREMMCEDCDEIFFTRHQLLEHKLNVHGSNDNKGQEKGLVRYECEVCGRRIYGLAALKVHMTKVHYKTATSFKFSCTLCIYKAQSRSQLGRHMRTKHGKEIMPSVQCETCGKMYGASYIAKHIATMHSTHTRNYDCNFCDMKFYDLAGLKFHIYHEHANKVWKCNKCPMEFKKYHQLRQHRIFVHSTKVHACSECPKTYKRKSDLTEHIKRLHLQRVVLLCPRCPKQYVNRFKLRNHLMKHHDVPWEDTLARNYARHQRANNCRRTEEGVLEASREQENIGKEGSIIIQESYDHFDDGQKEIIADASDHLEEGEYHDHFERQSDEHEYHAHYRHSINRNVEQQQQRSSHHQLASVKMEREDEPEEYIEIMEATDAFAKDGITYVIIEETENG